MSLKFHWFLPTSGDGRVIAALPAPDSDKITRQARAWKIGFCRPRRLRA